MDTESEGVPMEPLFSPFPAMSEGHFLPWVKGAAEAGNEEFGEEEEELEVDLLGLPGGREHPSTCICRALTSSAGRGGTDISHGAQGAQHNLHISWPWCPGAGVTL